MSAFCDLEQLSSCHQRAVSMPKPVSGTFQSHRSDFLLSSSKTPCPSATAVASNRSALDPGPNPTLSPSVGCGSQTSAHVKHNCRTCPPKPLAVSDKNSPWHLPIADGGGCSSSADWLVPRSASDMYSPLRTRFISLCAEWDLVARLQAHCRASSPDSLLSTAELSAVRNELVSFLRCAALPRSLRVEPRQPFLLDRWDGLCSLSQDPDPALPGILRSGVPTGVLEPIAASGVWQPLGEPVEFDADLSRLSIHTSPWKSGLEDEDLTLSLMLKDVADGFAFELPQSEAEAKRRWGHAVAAGKLGISQPPGKKPRLIGDGSVSGANAACWISEKVRLPTLESVQRFLSNSSSDQRWCAFSFDVRGAHKLIRVREPEQGLSCFVVKGRWFAYSSCYFGCRWAAYWFSRAGGFTVRQLHLFLWVCHGLFLYVDDGLSLFPVERAPLLAALCVMFLCALGIPLSWEKLAFGETLGWIGWDLCFPSRCALLPNTKQSKILAMLSPLVQPGRRLLRRDLERVIGLLLWFTGAASWLRSWLQEFYRLLYKPSVVTRALSVHQFGELLGCLSDSLLVISPTALSDVRPRWRLHSVNNCVVRCLGDQAIACPRVRSGQISVVFFDYSSEWTRTSSSSVFAAQLFHKAVSGHVQIALCVRDAPPCLCAADAFARGDSVGLGGWFLSPGDDCSLGRVKWFRLKLSRSDLPRWLRPAKGEPLQSFIASFEALAQLILLVLRCREFVRKRSDSFLVRLAQLCDNYGVVGASSRMLSMKEPLCWILQALEFWSVRFGVRLVCSEIAGVRNEWADALSRDGLAGVTAEHERRVSLAELLDAPWSSS